MIKSPVILATFAAGSLAGVLILGFARFGLVHPRPPVHFHANFAVFVDGERLDLSDDRYMEDVAACKIDETLVLPEERTHMHNNNADVVHVHDAGVTWGHFFTNIGFALGNDYFFTADGRRLFNTDNRRLTFIINDTPGFVIPKRLIGSNDRLLVSYGPIDDGSVAREQFAQVATSATEYNALGDPASCGGAVDDGFWAKLRRAFWS